MRKYINFDNFDNITINNENIKLFDSIFSNNNGFNKNESNAMELLKDTIQILDEFEINYFLISGTLLGYVRHNGFIPWDDDIDLIVDKKIFDKLEDISKKYTHINVYKQYADVLKFSNKLLSEKIKYKTYGYPFIDLFVYNQTDEHLLFFKKQWIINNFFPRKFVSFVGIDDVAIPNDPDYFLSINYGKNYLTKYVGSSWNHKNESKINVLGEISDKKYLELKKILS